jgi:uncharacterized protein
MRVLLDTNVWLAAFLTRGSCQELLEYCLETHEICASPFILEEIEEKLAKKLRFPKNRVKDIIRFVESEATIVPEGKVGKKICRDPDDDRVLAAALGGKARCLISGDDDLLSLKRVGPIVIVSPTEFWKWEKALDILPPGSRRITRS